MEKETMYWLFTTAPQAIAALVGIIFTGMFFMAESIDNRVRADQSLTEIAESAKTALYKSMKVVAVLAAITILYDLLLVAFVTKLTEEDCCWTEWPILIFAVLNFHRKVQSNGQRDLLPISLNSLSELWECQHQETN